MNENKERIIEDLQHQNSLLRAQISSSSDGILVVNKEGKIILFNPNFVKMWKIPDSVIKSGSDELALQSVVDKIDDPDKFLKKVNYLYDHPEEKSWDEIEMKDGRIFERYSSPAINGDGRNHGRIWYFRDITKRKKTEKDIELCETDKKMNEVLLERESRMEEIKKENSILKKKMKDIEGILPPKK